LVLTTNLPLYIFENNCRAFWNGTGAGGLNNGSTCHDGDRIIRMNGVYLFNQNRNIHDISNDTESWNLGCIAGLAQSGNTNAQSWAFGVWDDPTDNTKAWLDTCVADVAPIQFSVYSAAEMNIRNTSTNGRVMLIQGTVNKY
jgi:hypothetical protein